MTSYDHTLTTTPETAATMHADRETGHRMVMRLFPNSNNRHNRATWNVLWTCPQADTILVRTNHTEPLHLPEWVKQYDHTPTPTAPPTGQPVTLTVELAPLHTPSMWVDEHTRQTLKTGADGTERPAGEGLCYRTNKTPVTRDHLPQWVSNKLARHGMTTTSVTVHRYRTLRLTTKHNTIPAATITAHGTVDDQRTLQDAIETANGLGKGKPYGLACIQTTS